LIVVILAIFVVVGVIIALILHFLRKTASSLISSGRAAFTSAAYSSLDAPKTQTDREFPPKELWTQKLSANTIACPQCGAPVDGIGLVECEYCGSTVNVAAESKD
jgi:hypothetical protein